MTHSGNTLLKGLPGTNPLGFFAALGAQTALSEHGLERNLCWTEQSIPYPVLQPAVSLEEIAEATLSIADSWLKGPVLAEAVDPKLKLKPPAIREYLRRGRDAGASGVLAPCLLAEDSLDNNDTAKPTDLYFTAGPQKFVSIVRSNLDVTAQEIVADLATPWRYIVGDGKTLMWDTVDDRLHALSASDPSDQQKNMKPTNRGAEALAIIGLSRFPCFASPSGTLTQGCSGTWKRGVFVWPLWIVPASARAVDSLLAHVEPEKTDSEQAKSNSKRADWYQGWGISQIMQSQIRRSDRGGFGTFGPPRVIWQRPT